MITVAGKIKDLVGFLESGDLATLFADVELKAAREAFRRIPTAANRAAQTRTCIGHLNSCYHGYASSLRQMTMFDKVTWTRGAHFEAVRTKALFVLCVRALCHHYVGESDHCSEDLALAKEVRQIDTCEPGYCILWTVTPLGAIDAVYSIIRNEESQTRSYDLSDTAFEAFISLFSERRR